MPVKFYSHKTQPPLWLLLFIFLNLYNPFSPYLTLAFDFALLSFLLFRDRLRVTLLEPLLITAVLIVFIWLCLIVVFRGDLDIQVILKYSRITLFVILAALIIGSVSVPAILFVKALEIVLLFHILLIAIQVFWPDVSGFSARIFGFSRDLEILDGYSMRKLGASSSYDTASLFSIAGLLFFCLRYLQNHKIQYLLLIIATFIATLLSSRTGMGIAFVVIFIFMLRVIYISSFKLRVFIITGFSAMVAVIFEVLFPLFLHTVGLSELSSEHATLIFAATDYGTTGTLNALTNEHLQPLVRPLSEIIWGYGVDPNNVGWPTDIGYVKFIYHIGIVGTIIILAVHMGILVSAYKWANRVNSDSDLKMISWFLFYFLVITLAFNYKSLEIHSRGAGDFIYLIFLFLSRSNRKFYAKKYTFSTNG